MYDKGVQCLKKLDRELMQIYTDMRRQHSQVDLITSLQKREEKLARSEMNIEKALEMISHFDKKKIAVGDDKLPSWVCERILKETHVLFW
jgi:hypothetical protein